MQAIEGSSIINRSGSSTTSPITPLLCNCRNTLRLAVGRHNRDGFVVGRWQSAEESALLCSNKDAIRLDSVEVRVEIKRRTKALDGCDGSALSPFDAQTSSLKTLPSKQDPQIDPEDFGEQVRVRGESVAKGPG